MFHTVPVDVPVKESGTVVHLPVELLSESREDPEDAFEVGLHVPQQIEPVRLDLGERLLVRYDVPFGVLLRPKYADQSSPGVGLSAVREGLIVDVVGRFVLFQGAVGDHLVESLPGLCVSLVRIG